jgi:5-methylcytosine-specific restriction endonuclease McrA
MKKSTYTYPENWYSTKQKTLKIVDCCCNNPIHKGSLVMHHLKYRRSLIRRLLGIFLLHDPFKVSVSGLEIPGWDIVPVCERCHDNHYGRSKFESSVHHRKHWLQRGGLDNQQRFFKMVELRLKFLFLSFVK